MKPKKKPSQLDLLRAEIEALRKEIAALKATPPTVTHNHYHFGEGGLGTGVPIAPNPYQPSPWTPWHWPTVTCSFPVMTGCITDGTA